MPNRCPTSITRNTRDIGGLPVKAHNPWAS